MMIGGLRPISSDRLPTNGMMKTVEAIRVSWKDMLRVVCMALMNVIPVIATIFGAAYTVQPAYGIGFHEDVYLWIPVLGNRRLGALIFFCKGGSFVDPAANDVAGDDNEEAEEERNPPTPGIERFLRHVGGEWQEDRRGDDLVGLYALQREARIEVAPTKRRMLENHRARARDLTSYSKALDETENNEKHRREQADLLVGWQEADRHGREAHEQHAQDQHILATVGVAPVPENKRADRPCDVAYSVRRQ
jgi:hypothetical protein